MEIFLLIIAGIGILYFCIRYPFIIRLVLNIIMIIISGGKSGGFGGGKFSGGGGSSDY